MRDLDPASPFLPGVRVIVGYYRHWRERYVAKVYKNGNFILKGDIQQFRVWPPSSYTAGEWRARLAGASYNRDTVYLPTPERELWLGWNAQDERFYIAQDAIGKLCADKVPPEFTDALEVALAALHASPAGVR